MSVNIETIKTAAEIIAALTVIFGVIFSCHKWYLKQEKQDEDIKAMKKENTLICYGLRAALDGLEQLGANHTVPIAKEKLEKYLNEAAHK